MGRRSDASTHSASQWALSLLARHAWTSTALRERLAGKFDEAEVEAAIERLRELGLVDDRAYAERFVRDRFERSGYGRYRIRKDLISRGIAAEEADAVIGDLIGEEQERAGGVAALERFRRRRPQASSEEDDPRWQQAAFRHLVGRGFPSELVRDLLKVSL